MHNRNEHMHAPEPEGQPGWTRINIPTHAFVGESFVSGDPDSRRLRVAYFIHQEEKRLYAKAWFGKGAQGPPGYAHGGSISAVLDEAMGFAAWMDGHPVVAASLNVQFKKSIPLGTDCIVSAWVHKTDGRKIMVEGHISHPDTQHPFAISEGLFITQPMERFGEFGALREEVLQDKEVPN